MTLRLATKALEFALGHFCKYVLDADNDIPLRFDQQLRDGHATGSDWQLRIQLLGRLAHPVLFEVEEKGEEVVAVEEEEDEEEEAEEEGEEEEE